MRALIFANCEMKTDHLFAAAFLAIVTMVSACSRSPSVHPEPNQATNPVASVSDSSQAAVKSSESQALVAPGVFDEVAFAARLREALTDTTGQRWQRLSQIARSVSPKHFAAALAVAEQILPRQEWQNFRTVILMTWADGDLPAALAYAQTLTSSSEKQQAISAVLQSWAQRDPQAALKWVSQIQDETFRSGLIRKLLFSLLGTSPKIVAESLYMLPAAQQLEVARMLASQWAAESTHG